jgi:hypothetical protein
MSSVAEFFGWKSAVDTGDLPDIFPMPIAQADFVQKDVVTLYAKILTDTLERTSGLNDDQVAMCWDNCVKSNASKGLISLLADAMSKRSELFIVYEAGLKLVRVADQGEREQIEKDYLERGESKAGVFISFKAFDKTDMIKLYLGLEFCNVASLHKSMNISKAVQLKFFELRKSVALTDSDGPKAQALRMATALGAGKDIMLDSEDLVETSKPDLTAAEAGIQLVARKLGFYLNLPAAYITSEQTGGLNATGEADQVATERGLKGFYLSILKPTLEAVFDVKTAYKSQNFRMIMASMEVLKTFSVTDDTVVSADNKRKIFNRMVDLPEDEKADPPPKIVALPAPPPGAKPPVPPPGNA